MRILMTADTVGSVWTVCRELAERYVERGHAVVLLGIGPAVNEAQRAWCEQVRRSFPGHFHFEPCTSPLEWMDDNEHAYSAPAPTLLDLVRRFEPHVLHTSQYCFGALPTAVPRVVTAHHDLLSWSAACGPGSLEPAPWLDRYLVMVQLGLDNADAVAAPTHAMLAALARSFRITGMQSVIAHGRTLEPGRSAGKEQREVQAVTVARPWEQAENLALLAETHSPMPIVLARRRRYEAPYLTEQHPSIRLSGPLSDAALLDLFSASSVYVAPSVYEPFGMTPLEAALCGCAVAARNLPSLREVWGEAAQYFSSAAELRGLLARWNEDPEALEQAQEKSHARALALNADAMAEAYLKLYESLAERSRSARALRDLEETGS